MRKPQQWFSLQHMAWLLAYDVSTVRRWWNEGRFGPPAGEERADYWFKSDESTGANVRLSSRAYDFFVSSRAQPPRVAVVGRTEGEARRALNGVQE